MLKNELRNWNTLLLLLSISLNLVLIRHRATTARTTRSWTDETYAAALNQDLLRACYAADALFHRLQDEGKLRPEDQIVCDLLVDAISQTLP